MKTHHKAFTRMPQNQAGIFILCYSLLRVFIQQIILLVQWGLLNDTKFDCHFQKKRKILYFGPPSHKVELCMKYKVIQTKYFKSSLAYFFNLNMAHIIVAFDWRHKIFRLT